MKFFIDKKIIKDSFLERFINANAEVVGRFELRMIELGYLGV